MNKFSNNNQEFSPWKKSFVMEGGWPLYRDLLAKHGRWYCENMRSRFFDTWFSYTKFLVAFRYLKRSPKCLKSSVEYLKGLATCFETKTWSYFLSKGISANLARLIFRIYIWLITVAAISWVTRPASCQLAPLIANVFATEYLNLA